MKRQEEAEHEEWDDEDGIELLYKLDQQNDIYYSITNKLTESHALENITAQAGDRPHQNRGEPSRGKAIVPRDEWVGEPQERLDQQNDKIRIQNQLFWEVMRRRTSRIKQVIVPIRIEASHLGERPSFPGDGEAVDATRTDALNRSGASGLQRLRAVPAP